MVRNLQVTMSLRNHVCPWELFTVVTIEPFDEESIKLVTGIM
jgi:hypothetical protein